MKLLCRKDVARRLQVSQRTIIRWVSAGNFPKPITLPSSGKSINHAIRWPEIVIDVWVMEQYANRKDGAK